MSTLATIKTQLQTDIASANSATSGSDTTIHDAIATLIAGYGSGGSGSGSGGVELSDVEVYVGDYADSDTLDVESGAVNIYGRYITT